MVYRGHVRNGRVELDDPAALPEGAEVELTVVRPARVEYADRPIEEIIDEIMADVPVSEWDKLPPDLTDQIDHYVYGTPKQ
jgi:hypothetical protein